MSGQVIYPPNYPKITGKVVFLAGPITAAPDWQKDAIAFFTKYAPLLNVASPRNYQFTEDTFDNQVDWETYHLRLAATNGAIMFWMPKAIEVHHNGAYAQTTRFELAEWKVKHQYENTKLIIGAESGFPGINYIKRRFSQDCPQITIFDNLDDTCKCVISEILIDNCFIY